MSRLNRQKGKSQLNVSNGKNSKYSNDHNQDDVDTRSGTTRGSYTSSDEDRVNNWRVKEDVNPPPAPPLNSPVRTKLKSKASLFVPGQPALTSNAAAFIPQGIPQCNMPKAASPWTPPDGRPCGGGHGSSGKDCLQSVIQTTLGSELWDLSMVDYQSLDGTEWYTNVDVVIPALNASMCHLVTSQDFEAISAAQQASQSMAMQCVCDALQNLGPKVTAVPSGDAPVLSVQYCEADKDYLCWEFSHHGHCPRGSTCHWPHAFIETFLINFILQPLTSWGFGSPTTEAPNTAQGQVEMPPPPMANKQNHSSTLPGLPLTNFSSKTTDQQNDFFVDTDETPWPDHSKELGFNVKVANDDKPQITKTKSKDLTPTLRSKNPSRRMWADIQEDSDDEPFSLPQWQTSPTAQECQ